MTYTLVTNCNGMYTNSCTGAKTEEEWTWGNVRPGPGLWLVCPRLNEIQKTGALISNCLNSTFFYLLWGLLGYSTSLKYLNCICFTSFIAEVVRIKWNSLFSFVINTSSAIEHDYFVMNLFCFALHWFKVCVSKSFSTKFPRARVFPCWVTVLALFTVAFYFLFKGFWIFSLTKILGRVRGPARK